MNGWGILSQSALIRLPAVPSHLPDGRTRHYADGERIHPSFGQPAPSSHGEHGQAANRTQLTLLQLLYNHKTVGSIHTPSSAGGSSWCGHVARGCASSAVTTHVSFLEKLSNVAHRRRRGGKATPSNSRGSQRAYV
ncbi:hypothetical protein K1T71_006047 [Dendrolimus kikuchii]|uniref:Uncharacterized protein n=1 Tax=Dendrolimus kikuchii TaxID=765133 RepID=A0ACC1D3C9_9NEOP|nr:hypothetical protein K1T71_006047 [Dendrolimus kikuchii]